jgi:hypothetical protein
VKCPAAELRGIQFSKKLSFPLNPGLRSLEATSAEQAGRIKMGLMTRSSPLTLSPQRLCCNRGIEVFLNEVKNLMISTESIHRDSSAIASE